MNLAQPKMQNGAGRDNTHTHTHSRSVGCRYCMFTLAVAKCGRSGARMQCLVFWLVRYEPGRNVNTSKIKGDKIKDDINELFPSACKNSGWPVRALSRT